MGSYEGTKPTNELELTGEEIGSNVVRINYESDGFGPGLVSEADVIPLGEDKEMKRSGFVGKRKGESGLLLGNGVC